MLYFSCLCLYFCFYVSVYTFMPHYTCTFTVQSVYSVYMYVCFYFIVCLCLWVCFRLCAYIHYSPFYCLYVFTYVSVFMLLSICFIFTFSIVYPCSIQKHQSKSTLTRTHSLDSGMNASTSSTASSHPTMSNSSYHRLPQHSASAHFLQNNNTSNLKADSSDIHVCVLCMRALMNNAVSWTAHIEYTHPFIQDTVYVHVHVLSILHTPLYKTLCMYMYWVYHFKEVISYQGPMKKKIFFFHELLIVYICTCGHVQSRSPLKKNQILLFFHGLLV